MRRVVVTLALLSPGCLGTPTPLAPALGGSVGAPHRGVLTNGVELPAAGKGFVRYRRHGVANWGTPRLVRALQDVAAAVSDQFGGDPPLLVGDLSTRGGGRAPRHQSHRSGRDVDFPWFVTTPEGARIATPGFVAVGPDGLGRLEGSLAYVRLDVERQWALVKAWLTSPEASVQWMFASRDVEALLVDYARARGEAPALVWQAETVLMQPGDSLAHDDHLHLRIACSPEETLLGCEGGGPRWEWLPKLPELPGGDEWLYGLLEGEPAPPSVGEPPGAAPT